MLREDFFEFGWAIVGVDEALGLLLAVFPKNSPLGGYLTTRLLYFLNIIVSMVVRAVDAPKELGIINLLHKI